MRIVAVVRGGGQQQQAVGFGGQHLGKAAAPAVATGAMMRFVDDDEVPADPLQFGQHPVLLGEVDRGQAQRRGVERIAAEFQSVPGRAEACGIGDGGEAEAKAQTHLLLPLAEQGAGWANDQDTVGPPADQQFGGD